MFKYLILFFLVCFRLNASEPFKADTSAIDSSFIYAESAIYFKDQKAYEKALESANKSITFAKKIENNSSLANGYYTLGLVYLELKKYEVATEKFIRAVSIFNTLEPNSKLALSYYNLGVCYMHKGNYSSAESYFSKANSVYENIDLSDAKNMVNLQKAILYIEKNETKIAEKTLIELAYLPVNDDSNKLQYEAYYQLGMLKANEKVKQFIC